MMSSPSPKEKNKSTSGGSPQKGASSSSQIGKKEVSAAAYKAAFDIAKVLAGLSKKDQTAAMQMSGVQIGLSVTSQFARAAATAATPSSPAPKGSKGGKAPPPQKKWGEDVKAKQSEIASLNAMISEESGKIGKQLPSGHDLLKARDQAFRDLKGLKGKSSAAQ